MAGTEDESGSPRGSSFQAAAEEEPRLKYSLLGGESPRAAANGAAPATEFCVSDKVLAVGHRDGSVQLLDHLGNQVKVLKEHSREVTDLCFDEQAEYLASASSDGTVAVYGLYSEEVQRVKAAHPITAVALDPRYAARKTREVVYGTAQGTLVLSSKGWLGAKETILYGGKGPVHCARMSGTLLAWATSTGIRVYDTATHTRLGKLERPASAAADPSAPCSLLWRGGRELFVSWGRHVTVVRVASSLPPPTNPTIHAGAVAVKRSLQIVASFDAGCTALGAAPFGADVAVLCWGPPSNSGSSGHGSEAAAAAADAAGADGAVSPAAAGAAGAEPGPAIVDASTTADELPVSSPAGGGPPSPGAGDGADAASSAGTPAGHQPPAAAGTAAGATAGAAAGAGAAAAAAAQGNREEQHLSLGFFTRCGQLLAADGLPLSAWADERRWHQLAMLYSGTADLQLAAAAAAAGRSGSLGTSGLATPVRSSAAGIPAGGSPRAATANSAAAVSAAAVATAERESNVTPSKAGQGAAHGKGQQRVEQQQVEQQAEQQAVRQYKWWQDGEEPTYLVSGPEGIIVGRPRDGNDRVAWLSERGRYAEALSVAEEDYSVKPAVKESLGEQFLQALASEGRWAEAASLCPRVLKTNDLAWERWAYLFAQARQLAALAPQLPVEEPRLKSSTYDMVLSALLLNPAEHSMLLDCVRRWPQGAYNVAQLQAAALQRMGSAAGAPPGGSKGSKGAPAWPELQQVAAHLYTVQGRHEEALELQLQLRSPAVFDYISKHALEGRLAPYVADLVELDEVKATALLVHHQDEIPPAAVVASLQAAAEAAPAGEARQRWRRRLHHYLDWLFQRHSQQGAAFAELQVELYAEFEPARLLHFLMVSPHYPLDRAYQVCEERGLTGEMVYVLGRMGSADKALRLIVEGLRDVAQAVEFVQLQRDDDLWEPLIALTLGDAQLTGELLDHAGGYIDPLRVVSQIPEHMRVENLRGRLVKIITDFRTQMCLQQGCNAILRHDCVVLANRLYRVLRSSLRRLHLRLQQGGASKWVLYDTRSGEQAAEDDSVAAALLAGPWTAATAGAAGAASSAATPLRGQGEASPPVHAQQQQQQQQPQQQSPQQRVWIGFLGGPPAPEPTGADGWDAQQPRRQQQSPWQQPQQHGGAQQPGQSPSKFVRLAGGASPGPRKVLVS